MDPGVPCGGDEAGVFGFFAVDDPAAGFLRGLFAFEIAIIEGVASDEASVEQGVQKGDGGSHGGSVAEKIVFLTGFSAVKRRCVCCACACHQKHSARATAKPIAQGDRSDRKKPVCVAMLAPRKRATLRVVALARGALLRGV